MIRPFRWLVGYDIASFPSRFSAKIVNLCMSCGIEYTDLGVYTSGEEQRRRIMLYPIARLRLETLCRRCGVEIRLESRHGIPAAMRGIGRRWGMVIGVFVCALLIRAAQTVVWNVRVEGNERVSEERVEAILEECGIGIGARIDGLDIDSIENRALIISDEISWISVNLRGTVANVQIRETQSEPENDGIVCSNLLAERNGTVVGFSEVRGNIAVELGEAVSEGQLLVGGVFGSETEGVRLVRSSGSVFALCEREYEIEIPLKYGAKEYTGNKKVKKSLIFFKKEVKFFGNSRNSYASCDTIERVEYFNFFGLGELPFGIRTVTYLEYESVEGVRSEAQAAEQALYELWQRFYSEAPDAALCSKSIEGRLEGETYRLCARVETVENIAREQKIEIDID